MSFKRVVTRLLLAAAAAVAMTAAGSATASAIYVRYYCGWAVSPNSSCSDSRSGTNLIANTATYSGAGDVSVCERVVTPESGRTVSRRCRIKIAGSETDLNAYPVAFKVGTVGNDSNYTHTIDGSALFS